MEEETCLGKVCVTEFEYDFLVKLQELTYNHRNCFEFMLKYNNLERTTIKALLAIRSYPFNQANKMRPIIPVPSFSTHVIAAANGVASASPTPIPVSTACVVNVPVMVLQNACTVSHIW